MRWSLEWGRTRERERKKKKYENSWLYSLNITIDRCANGLENGWNKRPHSVNDDEKEERERKKEEKVSVRVRRREKAVSHFSHLTIHRSIWVDSAIYFTCASWLDALWFSPSASACLMPHSQLFSSLSACTCSMDFLKNRAHTLKWMRKRVCVWEGESKTPSYKLICLTSAFISLSPFECMRTKTSTGESSVWRRRKRREEEKSCGERWKLSLHYFCFISSPLQCASSPSLLLLFSFFLFFTLSSHFSVCFCQKQEQKLPSSSEEEEKKSIVTCSL